MKFYFKTIDSADSVKVDIKFELTHGDIKFKGK